MATEKNAVTAVAGRKGHSYRPHLTGQAFAGIAVTLQNCYTADAPSHSNL